MRERRERPGTLLSSFNTFVRVLFINCYARNSCYSILLEKTTSSKISFCDFLQNAFSKLSIHLYDPDDGRVLPLAILSTLMTLIMVGFIGMTLVFISSRIIPTMERITIKISSWFHLQNKINQ